jgi:uncharacterized delta-60 repeat protein
MALQSDGKIVVGGMICGEKLECDFLLARYNSNGTLDISFGGDGFVTTSFASYLYLEELCTTLVIQTDGKILAAGMSGDFFETSHLAMARYNPDGSLDTSFDGDGKLLTNVSYFDMSRAMAVQPDGKIIVVGTGDIIGYPMSEFRISIARLNNNGSFDTSFDEDGKQIIYSLPNSRGLAVALEPGGNIVVTGREDKLFAMVRLRSDGALDTTFDGDGVVITDFGYQFENDEARAVAIQLDGKIVAAGVSVRPGYWSGVMARYNHDGSLDTSFSEDGKVLFSFQENIYSRASSMALQANGRIVIGGKSGSDFALARLDGGMPPVQSDAFQSADKEDGWILEATEISNSGGTMNAAETTFTLGDGVLDKQYRAILSFNTAALPDTAVITRATLKIRVYGRLVGDNDPFTWGQGLGVDICKGTFGARALQLTDFNSNDSTNCKLLVGRFGKTPVNGWYSANLLSTADKIDQTGLTQFRLRFSKDDNDDKLSDYWRFFSGDHATASLRPTLTIEYYVP